MHKILLIDGLNFIYRGVISFGGHKIHEECINCQNEKHPIEIHCLCGASWHEIDKYCYGEKYNIIYNFFRNLRSLIEEFQPHKIFFVLEGQPKFRHELYPNYKANRKIIKTASSENKKSIKEKVLEDAAEIVKLLAFLPITCVRAADYECDDVIGTLAEDLKNEELIVVSNDTDHIQLLQRGYANISIYNSNKKVFMENTKEPYILLKSVKGDKTDNIPALLTPKKAEKVLSDPTLFQEWISIEENRANLAVNKKLVSFANVPLEEISFIEGKIGFNILKNIFLNMKFNSIINENYWNKFCSTFDCVIL